MEGESCVENGVRREEKAENSSSSYNRSGDYPVINGINSNGLSSGDKKKEHSSSSSGKDKHRDRDRHKDKDRHRDKEKHRDKDEHRHSSSNSHNKERSKDGHSSSRDKEKDRSKENRDKERDKNRDKDKEKKEHSSSSSSQRDKEKTSSSSSHSKEKHSSSKPHSSSSSKDKEKHNSSSSSSKDKHRTSGDKEKDKERDKSKHSSSSDKSKHSSSSSSKDKHRDRDKEKKHRDKDNKEEKVKELPREEKPVIKEEPREERHSFSFNSMKDEPSSSEGELRIKEEDDDDPNESSFNLQVNDPYRKSLEVKQEEDSEDDVPLVARKSVKRASPSDEDDVPLSARKKPKKEKDSKRKKKPESEDDYSDEEENDYKPAKNRSPKKPAKTAKATQESPTKRKKVKEEEQEVWKWWEEEKKSDGQKWNFLEHKGPVFAPPYEKLPDNVKFYYNGKEMKLSQDAEEVATFYGKMLDHDYTTKEAFNKNFFKDWRKTMTSKEREVITDLSKCNFRPMCSYFQQKSEERKAMSKEEKKALKEKNEELVKEYGFCTIDGHKEKIGNFRIEPPSLFRGRGEHPKMGMLKKRVMPEDVIINCSKGSKWPKPPPGHKWKEVRHDNTVTWLASWTENVQGQVKYVMLNPSSKLKGEKDWQKYEMARKLAHSIEKIRRDYREDWKSKEMRIRQRAVAMYFIDKLALRAGNEKDEDQADTVGCCSLRVEHIQLFAEKDGKEYVVCFDFLGKDSIRYYNEVPVEKRVFKNVQLFMENKKGSDDLFDRLNTSILNKHLNELMEGLTAKVFRTYNASWTLQQQLEQLTDPNYTLPEMVLAYNRANRAVAILCNHQRSVPKSHQKSMENLKEKIQTKREQIEEAEKQYKVAKKEARRSAKESITADKKKKALERLKEQLTKLEVQETDREENKTIALGTSKLNYLDPRISVAWCKKFNVPIDKVYNKTQRDKFRWAIDMAGADYVF